MELSSCMSSTTYLVDEVLSFSGVHDRLEEIQVSVGDERTRRRDELIGDWEDLKESSSLWGYGPRGGVSERSG